MILQSILQGIRRLSIYYQMDGHTGHLEVYHEHRVGRHQMITALAFVFGVERIEQQCIAGLYVSNVLKS
jgi:hypothetical protein